MFEPDELNRIRELYGTPEPDPLAQARVFARVKTGATRRTAPKIGLAIAVMMAAVTPAVVAPMLWPSAPAETPTLMGRPVLLAAAAEAERAPQGTYWRVALKSRVIQPDWFGKGRDRYQVETSAVMETWIDRSARRWIGLAQLPARPLDLDAWKADGSPRRWGVWAMKAGTPEVNRVRGMERFRAGGARLTFEELQGLPAESDALRAWVKKSVMSGDRPVQPHEVEGVTASALGGLLYGVPVMPEVRAAAFRALAALPSVQVEMGVRDPEGRTGTAVTWSASGAGAQGRLIIDPVTSMVLSSSFSGEAGYRTEVVLESGWTDEKPAPPDVGEITG
ncbi:CU044_5270 family protein [Nonomuraea longicatena]|uniref:Uncharacterized protein n=1 Tax=Nonomuraea longicatena TaxID=83682 RepID=A0ABP4BAF6_9ACTN